MKKHKILTIGMAAMIAPNNTEHCVVSPKVRFDIERQLHTPQFDKMYNRERKYRSRSYDNISTPSIRRVQQMQLKLLMIGQRENITEAERKLKALEEAYNEV